MRKRKLYLSELLKRYDFKSYHVAIIDMYGYKYFETIYEALKTEYINAEVRRWYINDITFIIYI